MAHSIRITDLPFSISEERQSDPEFKRNSRLALFPECAESEAIIIAKKKFGQKFNPMPYNWKGWDIISEDGSIRIEVKQTSVKGTKIDLTIGSTWHKKTYFTHIMIFDLYNEGLPTSIIPHDEFFASNFHGKTKLWRWNKDYNTKNQPINTPLFLKYKVK
tara:strand:- start:354 stop:833 length:480 start_codon:yes stop_codon:yes gene_type:complete